MHTIDYRTWVPTRPKQGRNTDAIPLCWIFDPRQPPQEALARKAEEDRLPEARYDVELPQQGEITGVVFRKTDTRVEEYPLPRNPLL